MSGPPSRPVALVVALTLAIGGLVISGISGFVGGFVGALLTVGAGAGESTVATALLVAVLLAATEAGFIVVGYAFRQTDDGAGIRVDWLPSNGPTTRDATLIVGATAALVAVNRLSFWAGSLVGIDPVTAVTTPEQFSATLLALLVPTMLLAVGPAEEYLFRGVVQGYLERTFPARRALGLSAGLFTLVHLPNLISNPEAGTVSVPLWLVIGVVLGWLYQRTEALLVPVLVHGCYNVAALSLLFAELGAV
ncbi:CPBP family intramembrane glutamic endopeptidase [Halolamina salifodinae]|uniref:Membrane protease YdiL (CAAX protease family) n=1 Tax=Halolamina salifodinae TaxID=1202767 RepID=A0A8T4H3K2_9EURY|nr:CPBP family intramembrane glutamic endopeptidase [Halolamina salifodinae]MBP1987768.1 membrane protease YdiL (CAAX protease family) [Halolamina salifodinae]